MDISCGNICLQIMCTLGKVCITNAYQKCVHLKKNQTKQNCLYRRKSAKIHISPSYSKSLQLVVFPWWAFLQTLKMFFRN